MEIVWKVSHTFQRKKHGIFIDNPLYSLQYSGHLGDPFITWFSVDDFLQTENVWRESHIISLRHSSNKGGNDLIWMKATGIPLSCYRHVDWMNRIKRLVFSVQKDFLVVSTSSIQPSNSCREFYRQLTKQHWPTTNTSHENWLKFASRPKLTKLFIMTGSLVATTLLIK